MRGEASELEVSSKKSHLSVKAGLEDKSRQRPALTEMSPKSKCSAEQKIVKAELGKKKGANCALTISCPG